MTADTPDPRPVSPLSELTYIWRTKTSIRDGSPTGRFVVDWEEAEAALDAARADPQADEGLGALSEWPCQKYNPPHDCGVITGNAPLPCGPCTARAALAASPATPAGLDATVIDAGGGEVRLLVDRRTHSYPVIGSRVVLRAASQPSEDGPAE